MTRAETPRVTVGLPVFNGERYLRAAIEAIRAQTLTDFELILSDNASTDGTEAICREYAARDDRIHYQREERNIGAAGNFNSVLARARADLFKWAAYDDLCAPELLERCVAAVDARPTTVLAYARTSLIDADGQPIGSYDDDLDLRGLGRVGRFRRFHDRFRDGGLVNVQYGVIRTAVLRSTPGLASYPGSDYVLMAELALRGEFLEVPDRLFLRRDHPRMTVRAMPSIRERGAYLDPGRQGPNRHPYLRMASGYLAAVRRVPMKPGERIACTALVGGFAARAAARFVKDRLPGR